MRVTVGMAEMGFATDANALIVTHALGSCVGIAIYDPLAMVGGVLHYMLPVSTIDKRRAQERPLMYGDLAIPKFFKVAYSLGAQKERLRVVMAGGAAVIPTNETFDIGRRNVGLARKLFWKNKILIAGEDVGEDYPRTLYLEMKSGRTWFSSRGQSYEL